MVKRYVERVGRWVMALFFFVQGRLSWRKLENKILYLALIGIKKDNIFHETEL